MAVVERAKEARSVRKIKTQIRWGDKDLEIFVMEKGNPGEVQKGKSKRLHGRGGTAGL